MGVVGPFVVDMIPTGGDCFVVECDRTKVVGLDDGRGQERGWYR